MENIKILDNISMMEELRFFDIDSYLDSDQFIIYNNLTNNSFAFLRQYIVFHTKKLIWK